MVAAIGVYEIAYIRNEGSICATKYVGLFPNKYPIYLNAGVCMRERVAIRCIFSFLFLMKWTDFFFSSFQFVASRQCV